MYFEDNDPFMTFVFAIIFLFFIYLAFDLLKDHWCLPRSTSHHIPNHHPPAMLFLFATDPSQTASSGLDPFILNSLPVFTFSSDDVTHMDTIDCAVCLSEFEEGESGRVLPGCRHAFHVECIDMWFHSHSTCPLCRSPVEQVVITIPPVPVSATEPGSTAIEVSRRMSRMLSFTRMLSRDRRSASSQSEPSSSCGIVVTESDIERGGQEIK